MKRLLGFLRPRVGSLSAVATGLVLLAALNGVFAPTRTQAQFGAPQTWVGTAGGTANALTLTVHNVATLNDLLGVPIHFLPSAVNTGAVTITINLDGGGTLGPTALDRVTSNIGLQALSGAELVNPVLTQTTYDGTEFVITSPIDMTPVGTVMDLRGTGAPRGSLLEDGSCYSQTTYAALFSVIGTLYNANAPVACSGGQFAVPYSNGTLFLAQDNQGAVHTANRVTTAGSGCNGQAFASVCGAQNHTQLLTELVAHTHVNTLTDPGHTHSNATPVPGGGASFSTWNTSTATTNATVTGPVSGSATTGVTITNASQGGGVAMPILNPLMIGLRAIKY